jgi:hypothetical protein
MFESSPKRKCQRAEDRFARAAEADDKQPADFLVCKGPDELGMKRGRLFVEIAVEIYERKAEEGFG